MFALLLGAVLGLLLSGSGPAHAQAPPGPANPVPVARVEEARNLPAENCADKEFKDRARDGQLALNARSGHGDEYDRLYRACLREVQHLQP